MLEKVIATIQAFEAGALSELEAIEKIHQLTGDYVDGSSLHDYGTWESLLAFAQRLANH